MNAQLVIAFGAGVPRSAGSRFRADVNDDPIIRSGPPYGGVMQLPPWFPAYGGMATLLIMPNSALLLPKVHN
jgi:hypothetical protein